MATKPTRSGSRGVVLNRETIKELEQALQRKWDSSQEKERSPTKRLNRDQKSAILGLNHQTITKLFDGYEPVDEKKVRQAFGRVDIPFIKERHCVAAPRPFDNLPVPPTRLIGRQTEVAEISALLESNRLVTLTGVAGIGKTRLAIQVAREVINRFAAGCCFVKLEALSTGSDIVRTIATTLGVREENDRPLLQTISDFLRDRPLLLVLDNCEHLLQTCAPLVHELLASTWRLTILATSRERLHTASEQLYPVPPLMTPTTTSLSNGTADMASFVLGYDSVALFVERARKVRLNFKVTSQNARDLAELCHRLDGIPLAIELAAVQLLYLASIEDINAKLDDRFGLLVDSDRLAVRRHRTLRAMVDSSYDPLSQSEKALLARLSVFAGGWTLAAAEAICREEADSEILYVLKGLVNKSLVIAEAMGGTTRYRMLETIRQYAIEKREASGEQARMKDRHRDYFLAFAEEAEPKLVVGKEAEWLPWLDREYDNLRASFEWSHQSRNVSACLRFCRALYRFWRTRGYVSEGRDWCTRALEMATDAGKTRDRAEALHVAGMLAHYQGDFRDARSFYEESLALWRAFEDDDNILRLLDSVGRVAAILGDFGNAIGYHEASLSLCRKVGDQKGVARSLRLLADSYFGQGDIATALSLLEESLNLCNKIGDRRGVVHALNGLGSMTAAQGDYTAARLYYEEVLTLRRENDSRRNIAHAIRNVGDAAYCQGDFETAVRYLSESVTIFREEEDYQGTAYSLCGLGNAVLSRGDAVMAIGHLNESLAILQKLGDQSGISYALRCIGDAACFRKDYTVAHAHLVEGLTCYRQIGKPAGIEDYLIFFAEVAMRTARAERASVLWGAAEALREKSGWSLPPNKRVQYPRDIAEAQQVLGRETFSVAWARGRAMTLDEAIAYALEDSPNSGAGNCSRW